MPTAAIMFAHDIGIRRYSEQEHTIVRWTDVDRGGHFAAMEEPALLGDDVRGVFRQLRQHKAVPERGARTGGTRRTPPAPGAERQQVRCREAGRRRCPRLAQR